MKRNLFIILAMFLYSLSNFSQTLEEYFKIAADNNPGLHAVYKEYEAALQNVPQVSTLPDPTFSFGYFISPVETRVGPQQAKFSLTQMFPWFGTLKVQGNAAALLAEAKFQSFIDARNLLYLQVASAYYPFFELKHWILIAQENIRILESYKTMATHKYENGNGTLVDVLRVEMLLQDAQTNLKIHKEKEISLLTTFNKLLNRPEKEKMQIHVSPKPEIPTDNYRKDSLIALNPRLKALDLKIQASKAEEEAAQKHGMPKFGIGLDYVMVGERNDISMIDNGKDVFMPMVSVSIPLFRSKYKASVKEAQLMQESYSLQKKDVANTLISEYEMHWFEVQRQLQLISLYKQQIQTSLQSLNLLFASYGNSGKEFEEVLRMQQQLLKYQKLNATAMAQYYLAIEKINYLTSKTYYNENNK